MTTTSPTTDTEYTKDWKDLSAGEIECCIAAHAEPLGLVWKNKKNFDALKRIFDLGKPKITFHVKGEYCRIAPESVGVMKVLIKQYL